MISLPTSLGIVLDEFFFNQLSSILKSSSSTTKALRDRLAIGIRFGLLRITFEVV